MRSIFLTVFLALFLIVTAQAQEVACPGLQEWEPKAIYMGGDRVRYKETAYEARWWTQGDNPAEHSGNWGVWVNLGTCIMPGPVVITSPKEGSVFTNFDPVPVEAEILYIDVAIDRVEFYANGKKYGEDKTAPYGIKELLPVTFGDVQLVAKAITPGGMEFKSEPVKISIIGVEPPRVTLPVDKEYEIGQKYEIIPTGEMYAFEVVNFYIDGMLVATDKTYPFSFTWAPEVYGDYNLVVEGITATGHQFSYFGVLRAREIIIPCGLVGAYQTECMPEPQ